MLGFALTRDKTTSTSVTVVKMQDNDNISDSGQFSEGSGGYDGQRDGHDGIERQMNDSDSSIAQGGKKSSKSGLSVRQIGTYGFKYERADCSGSITFFPLGRNI